MWKIWQYLLGLWNKYAHCPAFIKPVWDVFKMSILFFQQDRVHRMGAALAYYTIFSLPAILVIIIGLVGFFLGEAAVRGEIYSYLEKGVFATNKDIAMQIENAVRDIGNTSGNWWATALGIGFLVFVSTNIFYAMQETLNRIFRVEEVPQKVAILKIIINRVLSFLVVIGMSGLLVLSIALNTIVLKISNWVTQDGRRWIDNLPEEMEPVAPFLQYFSDYFLVFLNLGASVLILSTFFILLYKTLPAVKIRWNYVFWGAFWVSLFFWIGQIVLGYYLSKMHTISAYGAAGSLIILLIWVYYSAQLFFWGAEFIRAMYIYKNENMPPKGFAHKLQQIGS